MRFYKVFRYAFLGAIISIGLFASGCNPDNRTADTAIGASRTPGNQVFDTPINPNNTQPGRTPTIPLLVYTPTPTQVQISTPTPVNEINTQSSGLVVLWHPYQTGSPEKAALDKITSDISATYPNLELRNLEVPASEIVRDYQIDFLAGMGPDLVIMNNDLLGSLARAELVSALQPEALDSQVDYFQQTVEGLQVDGSLYGVPKSYTSVILYYRKSMLDSPPKTTEELIQLVRGGKPLATVLSPYHLYGWMGAFGGVLLDENNRCIADQGGWAQALNYLVELNSAGAFFLEDQQAADQMFLNGEAAMLADGSWQLNKYAELLGGDLGAAALPRGPAASSTPLVGVEGVFINPNTQNKDAASDVARYLTSSVSMREFADTGRLLPARKEVAITDEYLQAVRLSPEIGTAIPQLEEFSNYWIPFGEMFINVINGGIPAESGVSAACSAMNSANGK